MGLLSSIGSGLSDFLGSTAGKFLGGMIAGGASSALSYHFDLKQAKELAQYNMELQKELNEYNAVNRYPWAVKSLRDANLNPVLAATQGQPLSGGSVQAQAINAKRGQDVINTAMALGQLDNMREQNKNLQAQNDFIKAQTLTQVQSAREVKARVEGLERDLKWLRDNPEFYAAYMANRSVPHPLSGGMLSLLISELDGSSSARSLPKAVYEYFRGGYDK